MPAWRRWALAAAAGAILAGVAWVSRGVLGTVALAGALAYLVQPLVRWLQARGAPRGRAVLVAYGVVGGAALLFFLAVVPAVVREGGRLAADAPRYTRYVEDRVDRLAAAYRRAALPRPLRRAIEGGARELDAELRRTVARLGRGALGVPRRLLDALVVPLVAYYLLRDGPELWERVWCAVPTPWQPSLQAYLRDLDAVVGGYVRGQLVVAASVGALVAGALFLLGVPFPLFFGVLAAVTDLIPYVGPFAGAAPAVACALVRSPAVALWTALTFVLVHEVDANLITPRVVGGRVGLHPAVVILSLVAGERAAGLLGMVVAVPLAGAARVTAVHLVRAWGGAVP